MPVLADSKSGAVERYVRRQILSGRWEGGQRLPSEFELGKQLNVSQTTLRISMKTLANEGLIHRQQGVGSFVAKQPKAANILIVCPLPALSLTSGQHLRVLLELFHTAITAAGFTPCLVTIPNASLLESDFQREILFEHPGIKNAAGILSLMSLAPIASRLKALQAPVVEMVSGGEVAGQAVFYGMPDLYRLAFRTLRDRGFREIALFYPDFSLRNGAPDNRAELFSRLARDAEIAIPEEWLRPVLFEAWSMHGAYQAFKTFWLGARRRPPVVFFTQSALAMSAVSAIHELGIRVPDDLSLFTHINSGDEFCFPRKLSGVGFDLSAGAALVWNTLLEQIRDPSGLESPRVVSPIIFPGETLGRCHAPAGPRRPRVLAREELRGPSGDPLQGVWKTVSAYRFAEGLERYAVESDVFGRDRYCEFHDRFGTADGAWSPRNRRMDPSAGHSLRPMWSEMAVGLDPVGNVLFRAYNHGVLPLGEPDENLEAAEEKRRLDVYHDSIRIALEVSCNGGREFRETADITELAFQAGLRGRIVISCSDFTPLPDGRIVLPLYLQDGADAGALMLIGEGAGAQRRWRLGGVCPALPEAGGHFSESSAAPLDGGRLLCLIRGGKDAPAQAKWLTVSSDGGLTWGPARPLTYTDGAPLYSPSSCGYLVPHSSGRLFYIGNFHADDGICRTSASRTRLHLCEIDRDRLGVVPDSVLEIDGRQTGELDILALSNFWVHEERETRHICVDVPRCLRFASDYSDSQLMRLRVAVD